MKQKFIFKITLTILIQFCFYYGFSQKTNSILTNLPTNFKYQVITDSIPAYNFLAQSSSFNEGSQKLNIGCSPTVEVELDFSLVISHPFLFDWNHYKKDGSMIINAIKKSSLKQDSTVLKALDDYCFYGQMNYAHVTETHILFLYSKYTNSRHFADRLKNTSMWKMILDPLEVSLQSVDFITNETQDIVEGVNGFHEKKKIIGKYKLCSMALPARKIQKDNKELKISQGYENCNTILKFKRNGNAKAYSANEGRRLFLGNWKWNMDSQYIYIDKQNTRGMSGYQIVGPKRILSLNNNSKDGVILYPFP